jgi:hypothetical protein
MLDKNVIFMLMQDTRLSNRLRRDFLRSDKLFCFTVHLAHPQQLVARVTAATAAAFGLWL